MTPIPIDPSFATTGPEWGIGSVAPAQGAPAGGFAGMLGSSLQSLSATQAEATTQAQALATGQATDPAEVVMAVEKAQLAMQMATTMRNKGVEVIQELMRTQV
ncbi:MAG: flagellar hook-basal body complex protein FliE [Solirubrobacteraceae bacterium]|nr:flagellar hook-basal body complex protein FliE [Solirubrobacteraceae bacterium]